MATYRKKPVEIDAITFQELIEHGIKSGAELHNGMPWSFDFNGHAISHENDECYLIPTKTGTANFTPNDMLMIRTDEIYPCPMDVFNESYDKAGKTLHNSDESGTKENVSDVKVFGNTDMFQLLCKASSEKEGWMKSTKAMQINSETVSGSVAGVHGCLVQVTTQQKNPDGSYSVAEATEFIKGARIVEDMGHGRKLVHLKKNGGTVSM